MKKKLLMAFVAGLAVGVGGSCATWRVMIGAGPTAANTSRDTEAEKESDRQWAEPVACEGVPNLHRVSDGLYRGAQPNAAGMIQLKAMGVKTVVNLRKFHSDRDEIGETGLAYEHIYINPLHPEDEDVVRFLQIATDASRRPVFVHCQHGSDRTGLMCAAFRVAVQGWSKQEAIAEWTQGGFGFHESLRNLVKYFRKLDMEEIRRRAGLPPPPMSRQ